MEENSIIFVNATEDISYNKYHFYIWIGLHLLRKKENKKIKKIFKKGVK